MAPLSVYLQVHNALAYENLVSLYADAMTSLAGKAGKSYIIQCFRTKKGWILICFLLERLENP